MAWGRLLFHPRNVRVDQSNHRSCSQDSGAFLALLSIVFRDVSIMVAQTAKNLLASAGDLLLRWVKKIPWRSKRQPTPVFWPGKSHGQRSLVGFSPWCRKEFDMTEHARAHTHTHTHTQHHPV